MTSKCSTIIGFLLISISVGPFVLPASEQSRSIEEDVLLSIKQCLSESRVEWPSEWQEQYVDTIRQIVLEHRGKPDFSVRLDIIRNGLPLFWQHIDKSACSEGQFGVYRAEIRWYVEHLMAEKLSSEKDREVLKSQFRDLFNYAIQSMRAQFPILRTEMVEASLQDSLKRSYERIDAPLMPIYSKPLTEKQIKRIKTKCDRSHTDRSAFWRNLSGNRPDQKRDSTVADPKMHPHYLFTKRCLHKVLGSIWPVAAKPPDYCLKALQQRIQESKERQQFLQRQSEAEQKLTSRFSTRIEQVEQWSFILAALLETAACEQDRSTGSGNNEQASGMSSSEQVEGGGAP